MDTDVLVLVNVKVNVSTMLIVIFPADIVVLCFFHCAICIAYISTQLVDVAWLVLLISLCCCCGSSLE